MSSDDLNAIRDQVINDYRKKADLRFSEYETGRIEHCEFCIPHITPAPARVLDIGSGSGRDSAYFSSLGYQVTAAEPAVELQELAKQKYSHLDIHWRQDTLPELSGIKADNQLFNHIHLSAVIFHLPKDQTKKILETTVDLLKPQGTLFITVRNGPTDPDRPMFDVDKAHVLAEGKAFYNLLAEHRVCSNSRPDIYWDWLLFEKIN